MESRRGIPAVRIAAIARLALHLPSQQFFVDIFHPLD